MWSRRRPAERKHTDGFVLVEVLVTAAVASVLLVALLQALSTVWRGIGAVREDTEAMMVARAVIEASTPRHNLTQVTQQGTSGRYAWTISIASTGIQMSTEQPQQQNQGAAPVAPTNAAGQQRQNQPPSTNDGDGTRRNAGQGDQQQADKQPPWTLYKIVVAVRAPSGRRTNLETFRLSRPIAR